MNDIKVIVLFTNPIHRNMVPCPFYLDGNCRFELNKCRWAMNMTFWTHSKQQPTSKTVSIIWFHFFFHRFSHGETVLYTDLKDYNKPNFSLINQVKHPVLAKQADNIWYKGRVVTSDFNDKTCLIKFEHTKKEVKCDFHDVLPIEEGKSRKKKQAKRPAMTWNMEDWYEIYHL